MSRTVMPPQVMADFVDINKKEYVIEPICQVVPIAPSTYYRVKNLESRPEKCSLRSQHDEFYLGEIKQMPLWRP